MREVGGAKPCLFKRTVPTSSFRLAVVEHYSTHGMNPTLERFFGDLGGTQREMKWKSVHLWAKRHSAIATSSRAQLGQRRSLSTGTATILSPDVEREVVRWIKDLREHGAPVSAEMLKAKTQQLAHDSEGAPVFMASWSWRQSFLSRRALSFRAQTRQGQRSPADNAAAQASFAAALRGRMDELDLDVAYNADQTPIYFEHIPRATIITNGASTVWFQTGGKDKERVTCMLLGDSFGNKYNPFMVMKTAPAKAAKTADENATMRQGFGKRLWKDIKALQSDDNVTIHGNKSGWWNSDLSIQFLHHHFGS